MRGLLYGAVLLAMTVLAFWGVYRLDPNAPPPIRTHSVGFDNRYGNVTHLTVYVRVGGPPEHAVTATCDLTTCTFDLQLADGVHEILLSVEQDGRRSQPTRVTLDTRARSPR